MTRYRIVAEFETDSGHLAWVSRNEVALLLNDLGKDEGDFKLGAVKLEERSAR